MLEYQKILNAIALKQIKKEPHIPDMRLMVGSAEQLMPMPIFIYQNYMGDIPKALQQPINNLKIEDIQTGFNSGALTPDDFVNNTYFIGNPIDGGL